MTAIQQKALAALRQEYRSYLKSPRKDDTATNLRYARYSAKREFALELNLVAFNEVEVMESREIVEWEKTI
jgi:hypothetical protein